MYYFVKVKFYYLDISHMNDKKNANTLSNVLKLPLLVRVEISLLNDTTLKKD